MLGVDVVVGGRRGAGAHPAGAVEHEARWASLESARPVKTFEIVMFYSPIMFSIKNLKIIFSLFIIVINKC